MNDFKKATKSCPDFLEAKFQAPGSEVILNDEVSWESREDSEREKITNLGGFSRPFNFCGQ